MPLVPVQRERKVEVRETKMLFLHHGGNLSLTSSAEDFSYTLLQIHIICIYVVTELRGEQRMRQKERQRQTEEGI